MKNFVQNPKKLIATLILSLLATPLIFIAGYGLTHLAEFQNAMSSQTVGFQTGLWVSVFVLEITATVLSVGVGLILLILWCFRQLQ